MNYAISRYPYHHGVFKTDEYFEVYAYRDGQEETIGLALFGNRKDAEEYIVFREARDAEEKI